MTITLQPPLETPDTSAIDSMLNRIRLKSQMDIAFLARTFGSSGEIRVTNVDGAQTGTLDDLIVRRGAGLGGKALDLLRPASVSSYRQAAGITHDYDSQVLGERIEMLSAFPLRVGQSSPFVIYLGRRTATRVGDRWFDQVTPLLREFSALLHGPDTASALKPAHDDRLSKGQLEAALTELADLATMTNNPLMRTRLERLRQQLSPSEPTARVLPDSPLTHREIDVLRVIADGQSNRQCGEVLGLTENTVKSYLKSAMGKLNATNRVQAIAAARQFGVID